MARENGIEISPTALNRNNKAVVFSYLFHNFSYNRVKDVSKTCSWFLEAGPFCRAIEFTLV